MVWCLMLVVWCLMLVVCCDDPALMQISGISGGNVAKCAPEYGFVVIVQTSRLFRVGVERKNSPFSMSRCIVWYF